MIWRKAWPWPLPPSSAVATIRGREGRDTVSPIFNLSRLSSRRRTQDSVSPPRRRFHASTEPIAIDGDVKSPQSPDVPSCVDLGVGNCVNSARARLDTARYRDSRNSLTTNIHNSVRTLPWRARTFCFYAQRKLELLMVFASKPIIPTKIRSPWICWARRTHFPYTLCGIACRKAAAARALSACQNPR